MFRVERVGEHVSVLWMDDGRVNAIGPEFLEGFGPAFVEASAGRRAVVVAGNAKAFCAGLDLKALVGMDGARVEALARGFARVFRLPLQHPRPVVAAVNGAAIAGGAVLALGCDLRVAALEGRMGVTEVPVGVPFPLPVLELVRHRLPLPEHAPALLQGLVREGEAQAAKGWAHHVVPRDEVVGAAVKLAAGLAASSPLAFAESKRMLNAPLVEAYERFEREGAKEWAGWLLHADSRAALRATLDRMSKR